MAVNNKTLDYFLGANSPEGFFSYFDYLIDLSTTKDLYIIKGGPGTGKSHLMKKTAEELIDKGFNIERVICASDPESLDGIIINNNVAFVDGTAPHTIDPKYPGAVDRIINLGDMWNINILKTHKEEIIDLSSKIKLCYENAFRYLSAISQLRHDIISATLPGLQAKRLAGLSQRIIKKEIPKETGKGKKIKCFISGITFKGIVNLFDTVKSLGYRVYRLSDDYYVSGHFLKKISQAAKQAGLTFYECYCPLSPSEHPQHILIPSLNLAFLTSNRFHLYDGEYVRNISLNRYIDKPVIRSKRARLRFNKKAMENLLNECINCLKSAKELHDKLEEIYIAAMNFEGVERLRKKITEDITLDKE